MTAYAPVTPQQAAENAEILYREVGEYNAARRARFREDRIRRDQGGRFAPDPVAAQVVQLAGAEPEPADLSGGTGLTPRARAELIARAKARAIEFAVAVRSRNAHQVQRLAATLTGAEWRALAVTYAEVVDPSKLRIVVQTPDDGTPSHALEAARAA